MKYCCWTLTEQCHYHHGEIKSFLIKLWIYLCVILPKTGKRAAKSFCVKVSCLPRSAIVVSVVFHLFVLEHADLDVGSVSPLEKQCTCWHVPPFKYIKEKFVLLLKILDSCTENIFVMVSGRICFQQTVSCEPIPVNLFLYSYDANSMQRWDY